MTLETSFRWIAAYALLFCLVASHLLLRHDVASLQDRLPAALENFRETNHVSLKKRSVRDKPVTYHLEDSLEKSPSSAGKSVGLEFIRLGSSSRTSEDHPTSSQQVPPLPPKNAYSFLVAGCDPDEPERCRYFLYAVYISVHVLKKMGSKADFHLFVELLHASHHRKLADIDERVLRELGVAVHYIPTHPEQSFYRSQLQKFRVLGMTQYRHVFYLDSDILPLANLDYLFDLIDQGVLRKNVAFVGKAEPANGGSFILTPRPGALREINQLISKKEHSPWNATTGWGHEIVPPDRYVTSSLGERYLWDFFGGDGDQGLLFYWIKYVERDASFILNNGRIEQWGSGDGGQLLFLGSQKNALQNFSLPESICFDGASWCSGQRRPRRDFFHFTGDRKPWRLPKDFDIVSNRLTIDHYWFSLLEEVNHKHRLGLDVRISFRTNSSSLPLKSAGYERRFIQKLGPQVYTTLVDNVDGIEKSQGSRESHTAVHSSTQDSKLSSTAKYAYAFLIGGCEPDHPAKYRYFLYSIYVIIAILKRAGSVADFHVLVEIFSESRHHKLPDEEERVLAELGVQIHYIPKRPQQSFYALQLQKFRILGWVQYRHVMYLDSDVIPLTNLDYLFDFMDQGILRKHVAFVGKSEPANGGTFVLSPRPGVLEAVNALIYKKEHSVWNYTVGWGQEIIPPDRYLTSYRGEQTTWRFHGSDTDQGLLYYWIKYVEKDASFILENSTVEHWGSNESGGVKNLGSKQLKGQFPPLVVACENAPWCVGKRPRADFVHLTGNGMYERKPWCT